MLYLFFFVIEKYGPNYLGLCSPRLALRFSYIKNKNEQRCFNEKVKLSVMNRGAKCYFELKLFVL